MNFRPRHVSEEDLKAMQQRVMKNRVRERSALPDRGVTLGHARVSPASRQCNAVPLSPYKSSLESAWANYLHGLWMLKAIMGYWYEPLNLRLPGKKNFYKPDFLVQNAQGLTFYEVKGRNQSDDRSLVKIKTAAGVTPWATFILVKRIDGQWQERTIT